MPALQLGGTLSLAPEALEAVSKGPTFDMAAKLLTSNPNLEALRGADTQVRRRRGLAALTPACSPRLATPSTLLHHRTPQHPPPPPPPPHPPTHPPTPFLPPQAEATRYGQPFVEGFDLEASLAGLDLLPLAASVGQAPRLEQQTGQPLRLKAAGRLKLSARRTEADPTGSVSGPALLADGSPAPFGFYEGGAGLAGAGAAGAGVLALSAGAAGAEFGGGWC